MEYKIVVDSCCDMTPEMKEEWGVATVPLTLMLGKESFVDDDELDMPLFMDKMKNCREHIGTACPSPRMYSDAFEEGRTSFVVTLSSNLSGSNASALLGKTLAEEERAADVHVFDSKSASAGEILIVLKLRQFIDKGLSKLQIISSVQHFIDHMKTYFVLDNVDNLVKNGRLNKVVGRVISVLNIKPLMGSDGNGNIALFSHARGEKQIIEKMADTIEKSGKKTDGEPMVITHCNNPSLAEKLKEIIKARYRFGKILIVPTRGLSSLYANDKGIIMAF